MYNLWHKKQIGEIDHKYSKGVTILHLVKSALLSISILLPPKSTQLAIVSELDKINELIRLKKEQLKDFDNLAQSLFYEMFGDPMEKLFQTIVQSPMALYSREMVLKMVFQLSVLLT